MLKKTLRIACATAIAGVAILLWSVPAWAPPPPLPGPPTGSGVPLGGLEYAAAASFLASLAYMKVKRKK